jgi:hypothetical protein
VEYFGKCRFQQIGFFEEDEWNMLVRKLAFSRSDRVF